jgi:catechol 2,3-dioxygenase-like lactoylglutathione lyase family enzyme
MVRLGAVVLNVSNIQRASEFWRQALGYLPREGDAAVLGPSSGDGPLLWLDEDDRTHLDLWAVDEAEQQAEVERLVSLGATRVADWPYPDDADFVVLADPDGNLFCVIDASHS